jgi:hypothetical protein
LSLYRYVLACTVKTTCSVHTKQTQKIHYSLFPSYIKYTRTHEHTASRKDTGRQNTPYIENERNVGRLRSIIYSTRSDIFLSFLLLSVLLFLSFSTYSSTQKGSFSPQWRIWLCSYTTDDNNEKRREPLQGKNRSQVSSRRGHSELYTESALYWSMFFSFCNLNFSSKKWSNYYQKKTFTNSKHLVKIIVISDLWIRSSTYFTFLISTDTYICKQRLEKEEKNLPTKVHTIADE